MYIYTYTYSRILLSHIKDEILPCVTARTDQESIVLSQKEKDKNHMVSLMWGIKQKATNEQNKNTNKLIDTGNRMVVTREEGGENEEAKGVQVYGDGRRLDFQ